jgi:transposase
VINDIVTLPDERLRYVSHESNGDDFIIYVESSDMEAQCPYCGTSSQRIHSTYTRKLQDLPIQGKKVRLHLKNKKYFCRNPECAHRTFAEQFEFYEPKSVKTKRLKAEILRVSLTQSSISASKYLRESVADVSKSTICDMLKKEHEKSHCEIPNI